MRHPENQAYRKPVLFLDKVLMNPRKESVRGVEVFNLALLRELTQQGMPLFVPVHPSWRRLMATPPRTNGPFAADAAGRYDTPLPLPIVWTPLPSNLLNGILAVLRLRKRFGAVLLANSANSLIPAILLVRGLKRDTPIVLIAHREPSRRFLVSLPRASTAVRAVNSIIASRFTAAGFTRVETKYGIVHAGLFHPGPDTTGDRTPVNFCVMGYLDNPWKGADTAIAAFRCLPDALREKCRLHLVAYRNPPAFPETSIIVHPWMRFEDIPDFLRSMEVMIVPSRDEAVMRETFSQVMVQGMLTGLPVIANDLPVLREKLDRGGGRIFRHPDELVGHMTELAQSPALRRQLGREGRATALARYVWDTASFAREYLGGYSGGIPGRDAS